MSFYENSIKILAHKWLERELLLVNALQRGDMTLFPFLYSYQLAFSLTVLCSRFIVMLTQKYSLDYNFLKCDFSANIFQNYHNSPLLQQKKMYFPSLGDVISNKQLIFFVG